MSGGLICLLRLTRSAHLAPLHILGAHLSGKEYDREETNRKIEQVLRPETLLLAGDFNSDLRLALCLGSAGGWVSCGPSLCLV